jgi:TM2 domain-containing membrane protein YozV
LSAGGAQQQPPPPPPPQQQAAPVPHTPQYPQQQPQYAPPADPRMRGYAPPVPQNRQYATGRSPVAALILSAIIIGVGQFYNGDTKKGIVMLVIAIVVVPLTVGFAWLPLAIWSAVDAYQVASGKSALWS